MKWFYWHPHEPVFRHDPQHFIPYQAALRQGRHWWETVESLDPIAGDVREAPGRDGIQFRNAGVKKTVTSSEPEIPVMIRDHPFDVVSPQTTFGREDVKVV